MRGCSALITQHGIPSLLLAVGALHHGVSANPSAPLPIAVPAAELGEPPRWPTDEVLRAPHKRAATAAATQTSPSWQVDTSSKVAVQLFHRTLYAASNDVAPQWTGNIGRCEAGTTAAAFKQAIERRINWVRAMAGVPAAVQLDEDYNTRAQAAALLMAANGQLSHDPPSNWRCWTPLGAQGARANLAQGSGASVIENMYIHDHGADNPAVGHRRWVLYPQTRLMGIGDVHDATAVGTRPGNALWVIDDRLSAPRPATRDGFVAWPPVGFVPHTVVYPRWSLSYPDADFGSAVLTMRENGRLLPTQRERLQTGYGENTLVWLPGTYRDGMSWARPTSDTVYEVVVDNVIVSGRPTTMRYKVTVFDADAPPPWGRAPSSLSGPTVTAARASPYQFDAVAGADGYQLRAVSLQPLALFEGAESGAGNLTLGTSAGYDPVPTGSAATGLRSFHLTHATPTDQTLRLRTVVVPQITSTLRFASRLGWATPQQAALVEVSSDEGRSWQQAWRQPGTGNRGEPTYTQHDISLAPWAGRTVLLRFRYASGSPYYPQSDLDVGWHIDDITLLNADTIGASTQPAQGNSPLLSTSLPSAGRWLVQHRPGVGGLWADWSVGTAVSGVSLDTRSDCLLSWAERQFPQVLTPAARSSVSPPYRFRAYRNGVYLGISSSDSQVWLVDASGAQALGHHDGWFAIAQC